MINILPLKNKEEHESRVLSSTPIKHSGISVEIAAAVESPALVAVADSPPNCDANMAKASLSSSMSLVLKLAMFSVLICLVRAVVFCLCLVVAWFVVGWCWCCW